MARLANTHGGGSKTNLNGLHFEQQTSLDDALKDKGYIIDENGYVYKGNQQIGISAPKHKLYKIILEPKGVDYKKIISKKILPDEAFLNLSNNTVYIIEKKFQNGSGSVDEKIQTCDFKKKQYQKMTKSLNMKVEYTYILSDWFKQEMYADVLDYIKEMQCDYRFVDNFYTFNLL